MAEQNSTRFLIVNADDFGLTPGVNRGIIQAHEEGIVTSASLMVRYPAAVEAARYASTRPELSVGLHFDIAEWRYTHGEWRPFYLVVDPDDAAAVQAELQRQLAFYEDLVGCAPTHLDSHQHVHNSEPIRGAILELAHRLNIPLRACTPMIAYRGDFYGQTGQGDSYAEGIKLAHLQKTIETLASGVSELGCHPGYGEGLDSVYLRQREEEVKVLCRPELRTSLADAGVRLCSFRDLTTTAQLNQVSGSSAEPQ